MFAAGSLDSLCAGVKYNMSDLNDSKDSQEFQLNGILQISDKEFRKISDLVYSQFGINLTDKKKALVRGRLNKLIKSLGFDTFGEYYESVINDKTGKGLISLIDKISTNHSYFFRENEHFNFLLEEGFPEFAEKMSRTRELDLKIWSAGCAAGEEPYTLAILASEYFGQKIYRGRPVILATDISLTALEQAMEGVYVQERVKTVPKVLSDKHLRSHDSDKMAVSDDLKKMILFKRLNLMHDSFPFKGKFHFIFCRNVMIYFDNKTKMDLVEKFHRYLYNGGYLFIGHSETLGRGSSLFKYIKPALYQKIP